MPATLSTRDTVLVVEDEPKLAQVLVDYLQLAGFALRGSRTAATSWPPCARSRREWCSWT